MGNTVRLTVGQAIAKFFQNQWTERDGVEQRLIEKVCAIYGHGNLSGLGQGFVECGEEIESCQPFHEQSMVHMAVAFSKARRRLSTMACTASIGPGTANLFTGAAGATITKIPVLILASDHYGKRRQGIVMQQLEHPVEYDKSVADGLRSVSAFYDKIVRPEQLADSLMEATRVLTSPDETGAVTLSVCQDVQGEAGDFPVELFEKRVWHVARRPAEQAQLDRVVEMFKQAKQPLIISGGGVYYSEAESELLSFAEEFGIPVAETIAGRSTMRAESDMSVAALGVAGNFAANNLAWDADLVLAVGTRMLDVTTCAKTLFQNPDVKFASINVAGRDAFKLSAEPILADAKAGLSVLQSALREAGIEKQPAWTERVATEKANWTSHAAPTLVAENGKQMDQGQALKIVNDQIPQESYVVAVAGSLPGDVNKLWDARKGKRTHLDFGYSCMTYEIPGGIGLKMAGERNVVVCIGDGTYLMNPNDILVAAREKIDLTICVFVNRGYQIIRGLQELTTGTNFDTEFKEKTESNEVGRFLAYDLAKNAESLGAKVHRADTPEQLRSAMTTAQEESGPSVVVIEIDPYKVSVGTKHSFWDIAPPEVSTDPKAQELRANYEKRRDEEQRYYL